MLTLLVALYISVPALIGVMLFAISWMIKYKPEMIFEFQDLFIIGGVAGGNYYNSSQICCENNKRL